MRFFFDGQQDGRRIRSPVQLARWPDEPVDVRVRAIYDAVLQFASQRLLHDGTWEALETATAGDDTCRDILSYCWRSVAGLAMVAVNLSASPAHANIPIRADLLHEGETFRFDDALTGERYRWSSDALERIGLYVRLEPGAAHLFTVRATT